VVSTHSVVTCVFFVRERVLEKIGSGSESFVRYSPHVRRFSPGWLPGDPAFAFAPFGVHVRGEPGAGGMIRFAFGGVVTRLAELLSEHRVGPVGVHEYLQVWMVPVFQFPESLVVSVAVPTHAHKNCYRQDYVRLLFASICSGICSGWYLLIRCQGHTSPTCPGLPEHSDTCPICEWQAVGIRLDGQELPTRPVQSHRCLEHPQPLCSAYP
jgi:hypothetical protein